MTRQFNSAKIQLMMVDDAHPKGTGRLFYNAVEQISDDQLASLGSIIAKLSKAQYNGANVITTTSIAAN